MKSFKKALSMVIAISIFAASLIFAKADSNPEPAKGLLDNLLNYRTWVLDTIVNGNYSTNPFLTDCESFSEYSEDVYGRFMNNDVYSALVRIADVLQTSFLITHRLKAL